jgi:hypothetical protein
VILSGRVAFILISAVLFSGIAFSIGKVMVEKFDIGLAVREQILKQIIPNDKILKAILLETLTQAMIKDIRGRKPLNEEEAKKILEQRIKDVQSKVKNNKNVKKSRK